ncbi:hypothetical protein KIL84_015392 [Mauremys mutica]|uniref:Uncharacterized protein n=1 Tax=Mauremys mutica TaxID=74926 RepID=A0A9D3WSC1_9SAUR|nr:hypothetical protein KIL84_015392 [Mauremys mutica]
MAQSWPKPLEPLAGQAPPLRPCCPTACSLCHGLALLITLQAGAFSGSPTGRTWHRGLAKQQAKGAGTQWHLLCDASANSTGALGHGTQSHAQLVPPTAERHPLIRVPGTRVGRSATCPWHNSSQTGLGGGACAFPAGEGPHNLPADPAALAGDVAQLACPPGVLVSGQRWCAAAITRTEPGQAAAGTSPFTSSFSLAFWVKLVNLDVG